MIIYKKVKIIHIYGNRYRLIVGDMTVDANFTGILHIMHFIDKALGESGKVMTFNERKVII